VFSDEEVMLIRRTAASLRRRDQNTNNQLSSLVDVAEREELESLCMHIDMRMNQRKIDNRFGNNLKELVRAISLLPEEKRNIRNPSRALRLKRANAIRYVRQLRS